MISNSDITKIIHFSCAAITTFMFNIVFMIHFGFFLYIPILTYIILPYENSALTYFVITYSFMFSYFNIYILTIFIAALICNYIIVFKYSIDKEFNWFVNLLKYYLSIFHSEKNNQKINKPNHQKEINSSSKTENKEKPKEEKPEKVERIENENLKPEKPKAKDNTLDSFINNCNYVNSDKFREDIRKKRKEEGKPLTQEEIEIQNYRTIMGMEQAFINNTEKAQSITAEEKERIRHENMAKMERYREEQKRKKEEEQRKWREFEDKIKETDDKSQTIKFDDL